MSEPDAIRIGVHWSDTVTGRSGIYIDNAMRDDYDQNIPHLFNWEEGNYSCDCNRALFFVDADIVRCGDGRFLVHAIEWVGGRRDYDPPC